MADTGPDSSAPAVAAALSAAPAALSPIPIGVPAAAQPAPSASSYGAPAAADDAEQQQPATVATAPQAGADAPVLPPLPTSVSTPAPAAAPAPPAGAPAASSVDEGRRVTPRPSSGVRNRVVPDDDGGGVEAPAARKPVLGGDSASMIARGTLGQLRASAKGHNPRPSAVVVEEPRKLGFLASMLPVWLVSALGMGAPESPDPRRRGGRSQPDEAVEAYDLEMMASQLQLRPMEERVAELRDKPDVAEAFKKLDLDGSGGISKDELSELIAATGVELTHDELVSLIARVDKDGDGDVNPDELCAFLIERLDGIEMMQDEATLMSLAFSSTHDPVVEPRRIMRSLFELKAERSTEPPPPTIVAASGGGFNMARTVRLEPVWSADSDGCVSAQELYRVFSMEVVPGVPGLSLDEINTLMREFKLPELEAPVDGDPSPNKGASKVGGIRRSSRVTPDGASRATPKFVADARIRLADLQRHPAFQCEGQPAPAATPAASAPVGS